MFTERSPTRVLYIGGNARSGSTLANILLGKVDGHIPVGELFYLFQNGLKLNTSCGCGRPFRECPFWTAVGSDSFDGWKNLDADHVLRLQTRVCRAKAIPRIICDRYTSSFASDLSEYRQILSALYRGIRKASGCKVIVDSSKDTSTPFILRGSRGLEVTCIQLVRDPRAVAYSHSRVVPLKPGTDVFSEMPRISARKAARRWVTVNSTIRAIRRLGVPHLIVRYEDLVSDMPDELIRIAEFQGMSRGDIDWSSIEESRIASAENHMVAGGRVRFTEGWLAVRQDEEWKIALPAAQRIMVSALTAVSRTRYGYFSASNLNS